MSFFDPMPEPTPDRDAPDEQPWSPPLWDRPSEGTIPAVVSVSRLFDRTENVGLVLDHLRVYPNGFQLVVTTLANPRLPSEVRMGGFGTTLSLRAGSTGTDRGATPRPSPQPVRRAALMQPRVGVQFSNGQRAGAGLMPRGDVPKDEQGIPTEPLIFGGGGGGSGGQFRWEYWVFPLPSAGPLTVFTEWSPAGIGETSIVINGSDVRDAAQRAIVLWS